MAWQQSGPASRRAAAPRLSAAQRPIPATDRVRHGLARCPELDCIASLLTPADRAAAELRAAEIGTGADQVLIAANALSEDEYGRALAQWLAVPFEPLEETPRAQCPLDDEALLDAAAAGILPLRLDGQDWLAVAPQGLAARQLAQYVSIEPRLAERVTVTTATRLRAFVATRGAHALGYRAAHALVRTQPQFSAAARGSRVLLWTSVAIVACGL